MDFQFTIDEWDFTSGGGWMSIGLSKRPENTDEPRYGSIGGGENGIGAFMYYNSVNEGQKKKVFATHSVDKQRWVEIQQGETATITLRKGETAWDFYLSDEFTKSQPDGMMWLFEVPYTTFPADGFENGQAYLSLYFSGANESGVKISVNRIRETVDPSTEPPTSIYTQEKDVSLENWSANRGFEKVEGSKASFIGQGDFRANFSYQQPIVVTNEMEFDLTIDSWPLKEGYNTWFAIQLNKKPETNTDEPLYFQPGGGSANGIGAFLYRQAREGVFQTAQGSWLEIPSGDKTTITVKKGETAWEFYFKNTWTEGKQGLLYTVPYDSFAADGFKTGKAYLNIYIYDCNEKEVVFNTAKMSVTRIQETIDPSFQPGEEDQGQRIQPGHLHHPLLGRQHGI